MKRDEAEIIERIRAAVGGDRRAFEELVLLKREQVVRTAYQIVGDLEDARDVAQAVFIRLWTVLRRFDPKRRFDTWVYRITVNQAIDFLRRRGPKGFMHPLPDDPTSLAVDPGPSPDQGIDFALLQKAFFRLAAQLGSKQRAVFVLHEIEGIETAEIASTLGVTESTVRNHLQQARRILRRGLERDYPALVPKPRAGSSR